MQAKADEETAKRAQLEKARADHERRRGVLIRGGGSDSDLASDVRAQVERNDRCRLQDNEIIEENGGIVATLIVESAMGESKIVVFFHGDYPTCAPQIRSIDGSHVDVSLECGESINGIILKSTKYFKAPLQPLTEEKRLRLLEEGHVQGVRDARYMLAEHQQQQQEHVRQQEQQRQQVLPTDPTGHLLPQPKRGFFKRNKKAIIGSLAGVGVVTVGYVVFHFFL